jgi:hypothetical protein
VIIVSTAHAGPAVQAIWPGYGVSKSLHTFAKLLLEEVLDVAGDDAKPDEVFRREQVSVTVLDVGEDLDDAAELHVDRAFGGDLHRCVPSQ